MVSCPVWYSLNGILIQNFCQFKKENLLKALVTLHISPIWSEPPSMRTANYPWSGSHMELFCSFSIFVLVKTLTKQWTKAENPFWPNCGVCWVTLAFNDLFCSPIPGQFSNSNQFNSNLERKSGLGTRRKESWSGKLASLIFWDSSMFSIVFWLTSAYIGPVHTTQEKFENAAITGDRNAWVRPRACA